MFTQFEEEVLVKETVTHTHRLIVHNDNINTFDWVILALIEVCKHSMEQAEQCSLFIHYKGKYAVKQGDFTSLNNMRIAISERGIGVTVEEI
ncbi:MAG: ATP-dependent Clp protease adaptor ClpS [Chitinophagales bacterium]|nr:ATP-dependent Clp protease adaptor ClpS [Chitinophagales bacterium]MCO5281752.1 ATP-dependent Clp protease adaptor ClpS [Chitinophagales bacterium]OJV29068.1 MAG: Clp protease ClpS [Bacteroidetes bacterium 37-13]HRN94617.1 ATP-dependent Clp protease adaptor ClpS [Chitinophagales bacterium]HRP39892.1 ATP-dependent Clp protease adaptor ClpS [Chitinophagales bacterium]